MSKKQPLRPRSAESPWLQSIRILAGNRMAMVGMAAILFWIVVATAAPLIATADPLAQDLLNRLTPPSAGHFFGTDELGRDVFSRVVYGSRISLPVGVTVIGFALLVGSMLGAVAGFSGGLLDQVIMRTADVTLAFPSIVLALAIASVLGPDLKNAAIAMIVVWWPEYARLMRAQVLTVKNNEYVTAAQVIGVPPQLVLLRHIVPNTIAPIIVKASLDVGTAILTIAALSFIGLG
ncbi:MAG: ABC transporter permease, partial [Anaerolineales bacterium]|nr:ABC transporter permease [Anaerolineales bacterium]